MDLPQEDAQFLEELADKFAISSVDELISLIDTLKAIAVKTPILEKFMKLLEDTNASIEEKEYLIPNVEVLDSWKELASQIQSSKIPELEVYAVYLWNLLQIKVFMIISPSNELFQPLSVAFIEKCQENAQTAAKFKKPAAEAYFRYNRAYQFFMLFKYGPKNKEFLDNAIAGFKDIIPMYYSKNLRADEI